MLLSTAAWPLRLPANSYNGQCLLDRSAMLRPDRRAHEDFANIAENCGFVISNSLSLCQRGAPVEGIQRFFVAAQREVRGADVG